MKNQEVKRFTLFENATGNSARKNNNNNFGDFRKCTSDAPVIWGKVFDDVKNGESRGGGGSKKKINICLVYRHSVGEHYILITFEFAIKNESVQTAYFHHLFTRMDARLSDTFRMSTTHVDCKNQLRVRV